MAEIVINDIEPIISYTAAGAETGYAYPFPIFDEDDLVVLEITTAGVINTLAKSTHYTVAGVGLANGGTITFSLVTYPSGATAGYRYVLYRDLAVSRGTDFLTGGDFKASTVNRELDKVIMMVQQNELEIKRGLGLQKADAEDELNFEIETAANRAGKLLSFGTNGDTVKGVTPASVALSDIDTLFSGLANGDFLYQESGNFVNKTTDEIKTILDLKLNNFAATGAPTVNDDSGDGYSIGSQWYDGSNDNMYHCLDATVGAAVWVQGDIVAADLGSAAVVDVVDIAGRLIDVQTFTAGGTWTKPANTNAVEVEVYAGSGGGAGVGSSPTAGGAGGNSAFGAHATATGGAAGTSLSNASFSRAANGIGSSGDFNGVGLPGGDGGKEAQGGSQWDMSEHGGHGGLSKKYITSGLGATETVTVGAAGTAGTGGEPGLPGQAGYVVVKSYT